MPEHPQNPVTVEGVDLGRHLFYDPVLSVDSSISCASCHKQRYAFSDAPLAYSVGVTGRQMRRNTMPLFNLAWYKAYFWDGRTGTIENQAFVPVAHVHEMGLSWTIAVKRLCKSPFYRHKFKMAFGNSHIDSTKIAYALAQFERTLISHNSKYDRVLRGEDVFTKDEFKGFELVNDMTRGDCLHCHTTDGNGLGTNGMFSNNGLENIYDPEKYTDKGLGETTGKITDNGKFKTPSLRNLLFTAPYMHDGRFKTLEEVIDFYSEGVHPSANVDAKMEFASTHGPQLTNIEKKQIILFLYTLTDSVFVNNNAFSNPFLN